MDMSRGDLSNIDRKLLASLTNSATSQMVRVPTTPMLWATWRRYCEAAGLPMGRAIAVLMVQELERAFGDGATEVQPISEQVRERLRQREAALAAREERLRIREAQVRTLLRTVGMHKPATSTPERQVPVVGASPPVPPATPRRPGRNEACHCGSGQKYKYCHGRPV